MEVFPNEEVVLCDTGTTDDAEPTPFAISMSRIGGGACVIIGVIIGIIGFMGGRL